MTIDTGATATTGTGRPLAARVAIVTGAGHGIGRAYALRLAGQGSSVVVADVDGSGAEATAEAISAAGGTALSVEVDVSDEDSLDRMRRETVDAFGRADILVNNAAIFATVPMSRVSFEDVTVEEWDRMMAVNVKGTWLTCRAVVPLMRERGYGKIINVSSDTAFKGSPLRIHYVTSKSALLGFTRTLASELGPAGIRVNAVAPGIVLSEERPAASTAGRREAAARAQVLPDVLLPDDVAGTVVFLASPESDAITGQVLLVNGGAHMY